MKNKEMLHMMDAIDDDLIDSANPETLSPKKKKPRFLNGMLAACLLCAVLAVNLAIFMPMFNEDNPFIDSGNQSTSGKPTGSTGGGNEVTGGGTTDGGSNQAVSEYDSIYESLNEYWSNINYDYEDALPPGAVPDGTTGGSVGYQEVTDNQVQGVIEGDLFKRTDEYIFYLSANELRAYSIKGADSERVGVYKLSQSDIFDKEMYLSDDGKTATVFYSLGGEVKVISLDVSTPAEITKKNEFSIKGYYISSRKVNGQFILLTSKSFYSGEKSEPSSFVPSVNTGNGYECLAPDCITLPASISSPTYKIVSLLDEDGLSYGGTMAYLGYSSTWYVSQENIYLTHSYTEKTELTPTPPYTSETHTNDITDITRISYSGGKLVNQGNISIKGSVDDQYSLDEYNGILRVVTSIDGYITKAQPYDKTPGFSSTTTARNISASLYCIDISTMELLSAVECFAPQGESVQSARFDGDTAYVCTSVVFTDPVFYFDLSDINNITYKDTGDINGYSTSLKSLGNGYLLGIGYLDSSTVKIEIYKETEAGVESAGVFEIAASYISSDYKSYNIDIENQLICFAAKEYSEDYYNECFYYILKYEIQENNTVEIKELVPRYQMSALAASYSARGVLIDGYYYILSPGDFSVQKIIP